MSVIVDNMFSLSLFFKANLVFFSLAYALSILPLIIVNVFPKFWRFSELMLVISGLIISGVVTIYLTGSKEISVVILIFAILVTLPQLKLFPNFSLSGKNFYLANFAFLFAGAFWGTYFIYTIPVSLTTRILMFSAFPFFIMTLPFMFIQIFEQFEVLTHKKWQRPRFPTNIPPRESYPMVSLHVPTHAEPPDLVIDTLNLLARADYPNFEVLVIDNNTEDEKLWRPLEEHCKKLGDRFKFFHLSHIEGAKAGALNFATTKTSPAAEIIGVIDADYKAHVLFMKSLVNYFDDPKMGFVQTPHDYLGWENNKYLTMCYWEYELFFKTTMVSLNERNVSLTVGTMCLIRKQALIEAGGWSTWCLTEDSELAIRIHALGYNSLFLGTSFGWGLIPETFDGYKKQRFRWSAGPIQEIKHHFSILSPFFAKKTSLNSIQKWEHFNHGVDRAGIGLGFLLTPISFLIVISMIYHKEAIAVPYELWIAATIVLISSTTLSVFVYRFIVHCPLKDILGALIASKSLSHVITMACISALFKDRFSWGRTNKFKQLPSGINALFAVEQELIIGGGLVIFALFAFVIFPATGLFLMFLIGLIFKSADYFAAVYMAVLSEMELKRINDIKVPEGFATVIRK